jgi:hypothetical protein
MKLQRRSSFVKESIAREALAVKKVSAVFAESVDRSAL